MNSANHDDVNRAVKAREQGQAKIRSVTTTVAAASVITADAVALTLPGSAHATRCPGFFPRLPERELRFREFPRHQWLQLWHRSCRRFGQRPGHVRRHVR